MARRYAKTKLNTSVFSSSFTLWLAIFISLALAGCGMISGGVTQYSKLSSKITLPISVNVIPVYSVNGANWNDYVKRSDSTKDAFSQTDSPCTGATSFMDCIHGGEKRMVPTGANSCEGLSIAESLGAFNWTCKVVGDQAYFMTIGLKPGKGLADLISETGWKTNQVTISYGTTAYAVSTPAAWWNNPILQLPDNSSSASLYNLPQTAGAPGNIFVVSADQMVSAYNVPSKVAIVSLNGAKLKPTDASAGSNVCAGDGFPLVSCVLNLQSSANFTWIETNIEYTTTSAPKYAVSINSSQFYRLINSNITESEASAASGTVAVYGYQANYGKLLNLQLSGFDYGIKFDSFCTANLLQNIFTRSGNWGVYLHAFDTSNTIESLYSFNNYRGYENDGWTTTLIGYSDFNSHSGVMLSSAFGNEASVFLSFLSVNSGYNTMNASLYNSQDYNTFANIAVTDSVSAINVLQDFSDMNGIGPNQFSGILLLGNNTTNCQSANSSLGLINSTCANALSDGTSAYTGSSSNAILRLNRTAANSFKGLVTSDDVTNNYDTLGQAAYSSLVPGAWYPFLDAFRAWGIYSVAQNFLTKTTVQGQCTSGTCQIFDWSLLQTDTVFRNVSGDGSNQNHDFVSGQPCPAEIQGSVTVTSLGSSPVTFLRNAEEIIIDGQGNGNGLCESGESCLYMPNIGAYQGHGDYSDNFCIFQDGTISNVKMYAFPENGF